MLGESEPDKIKVETDVIPFKDFINILLKNQILTTITFNKSNLTSQNINLLFDILSIKPTLFNITFISPINNIDIFLKNVKKLLITNNNIDKQLFIDFNNINNELFITINNKNFYKKIEYLLCSFIK